MRLTGHYEPLFVYLVYILAVNGDILHNYCLVNGSMRQYDPTLERCDAGNIVSLSTVPPPPPTTTTTTTTTAATTTTTTAATTAASHSSCGLSHEKIKDGYHCCAYDAYHPTYQTCCQVTSWKARVHDDKPAKSHACCLLDAHKRNEESCRRNPGHNDKFWESEKLGKTGPEVLVCQIYRYAFKLHVEDHRDLQGNNVVTIEQIYPKRRKNSSLTRNNMPIPTDQYSPTQNLADQTFLVLSNTDHLDSQYMDVFLGTHDQIYKIPKRKERRLEKIVRKSFRRCKRVGRKRHPGKKGGHKRHSRKERRRSQGSYR